MLQKFLGEPRRGSRLFFLLPAGLAALLLVGCQSPSSAVVVALPAMDDAQRQSRLQQVAARDHWQLRGRIGMRGVGEAVTLGVVWQQLGNHYNIELKDPLGRRGAGLIGTEVGMLLHRPGKPSLYTWKPEDLLMETLGWRIPVNQLAFWARGLPAPPQEKAVLSQVDGQESLNQDGWRIAYDRHQQVGDCVLPGRLVADNGILKLTLIINDWTVSGCGQGSSQTVVRS